MNFTTPLVTAATGLTACAAIGTAIGTAIVQRFTTTRRRLPQPFEGEALQVSFPARDGRARIDGWYLAGPANAGQPAVVLMHARGARRGDELGTPRLGLARVLVGAGLAVLMIDQRGQGTGRHARMTDGERERFGELGAVDWLRERGHRRVGVLGASMAATIAPLAGVAMRHRRLLARAV